MPYIHVQVSGAADDALAERIADAATQLTATLLGKRAGLSAAVVDFIPSRRWRVADKVLKDGEPRAFHWMVSITDETNTKQEKAAYLAAVHKAMDELLGGAAEHSYIHVADLRGSAYGYGGLTQEYRYQQA
jgi:4-oxalocrotonate tautomerase